MTFASLPSSNLPYEDILYEEHEGVARITINRPEVYNAVRGAPPRSCSTPSAAPAGTERSAWSC
ncbi:1,4-dihydroxy-2-naphthoyl-CoA synthase [Variovorax boronicumulans]|nr:1,4-dihydroxy-2-naphthoyl-CoA synthase [Variovorax boronicumulans]